MPDGASHRVSYDGHGRVSRVAREGIATVEYEYEPETGLLSSKRFVSPQEQEVRSESWIYDDIGRATHEIHADAITGETQTYRFYYDGATPEQPKARNAPGLLTAVTGEGYSKRFEHRADGKVVRSTLVLDGWRAVESEVARYAENGEVAEETTTVKDSGGQVLSTVRKRYGWDAYGRLSTLEINGEPLASFLYTARGLLAGVDFGGAGSVTFGYDEVTEARASVEQTTPAWTSSVSWRLNSRGFTDAEQLEVGATRLTRQYSYSPEGFLTGSQDAEHSYAYGFDANGLPVSITESGSTRALVMEGDSLDAGGVLYGFDELGRTEVKGDLVQSYGPNGQVATASRGGSSWGYLYDEHGQRLVKRTGAGVPVAAYLDDGSYLDGTGLTEPVHVGGQLVGLLKNGVFRMLAVDRRGTVLAEADGTARLASPFGSRSVHPADAAAVDYVEKGYDADLGVVRMGVRDYDPAIHRFTTPDPLFLEQPDRCVASPVECNLYGYARNRPLDYVDPEGTCVSCWLANAVNRFGPAVEQAVRRAGPAIVQSVRQAGPRLNQAARQFLPRLQATVRQGAEFVKQDAKAAQQRVKNTVELTKNVVSRLADRAPTAAQGSADASLAAARGAPAITKGEQVTEQMIREVMKDAPLVTQQSGGVSLPLIRQYVDKLLAGEVAPAIKVDGRIIVDGNHRYIAARLLGREPAIQQWAGGAA